jgi:fructose-specific phosphotransferase system IIC component
VSPLTRILLVVAIILVALVGLGFGLCGVVGLTLGLGNRATSGGTDLFVIICGVSGIALAIAAGMFIYTKLWKALRRKDKD